MNNQSSCPLCYNSLDDENVLFICEFCGLTRCSECETGTCCERICGVCLQYELTGDGNNEKICEVCHKTVCLQCTAVTGCQTVDGTCKKCFVYLCVVCRIIPLDKETCYLVDMKEHFPTCDACKDKY